MARLLSNSQFPLFRFCSNQNCLIFSQRTNYQRSYTKWRKQGTKIFAFGIGGGVLAGVFLSQSTVDSDVTTKGEKKTNCNLTACESDKYTCGKITLKQAVAKSRDLIQRVKDESGSPGVVIGVSVNGETIWTEGFGFADVENRLPMSPDAVLRIASISKPITMAIAGKLWEMGKLDIDAPVQTYVPYFPEKIVEGEKVKITTRQLVSHLSGIRHYKKNTKTKDSDKEKEKTTKDKNEKKNNKDDKPVEGAGDEQFKEFYLAKKFSSVEESVGLFKDDPLLHKPGTKFVYTTHGWTLVSAVLEGASGVKFPTLLNAIFLNLGMANTYLDRNDPLIYHRARNYVRNKKGRLINAPYVDLSYKWAGGGLLSTVGDLLTFGNVMLYSYQHSDETSQYPGESPKEKFPNNSSLNKCVENTNCDEKNVKNLPGYLKQNTVKEIWSVVKNTELPKDTSAGYGMGWGVFAEKKKYGGCVHRQYYVSHTGGAMGASSALLVYPTESSRLLQGHSQVPSEKQGHTQGYTQGHSGNEGQTQVQSENQGHAQGHAQGHLEIQGHAIIDGQGQMFENIKDDNNISTEDCLPSGVSVAIIANLSSVGLNKTALEIAKLFDKINH